MAAGHLMGNLMGIPGGKPVGFSPISAPTPCKGVGNGKTEVENSHRDGKWELRKEQPVQIHGTACLLRRAEDGYEVVNEETRACIASDPGRFMAAARAAAALRS